MEEKILLIRSMQKLINRKNQEEIFASLSRSDFKKIIENLDDDSEQLRKISMNLIPLLLFNNPTLKQKFCSIMSIPIIPGRIALNNRLCASSTTRKSILQNQMISNIKEVYTLVRQPIREHEQRCLYWFIHFEHRREGGLQIQFANPVNPQNIVINQSLDPLDCTIGFVLAENNFPKMQIEHRPQVITSRQDKRVKKDNQPAYMTNNFFYTSYKQEPVKNGLQLMNFNKILNLNRPGYATDRQMAPNNTRVIDKVTFSPESKHIYPKNNNEGPQSLKLQFRANYGDSEVKKRGNYKQIRTVTSSPNKRPGQYLEGNAVFLVSPKMVQGGWVMNSADRAHQPPPPPYQYAYEPKRLIQKYQV